MKHTDLPLININKIELCPFTIELSWFCITGNLVVCFLALIGLRYKTAIFENVSAVSVVTTGHEHGELNVFLGLTNLTE